MKISQFLLLCASTVILASCTSYGKKYEVDKEHEVYYKGDGVDESNAKKLGDYLKEQGYFIEGQKATVQITKVKDVYNVNFVVDKSKIDADKEDKFKIFGGQIAEAVFGGVPIVVNLCNETLESFKAISIAKAVPEETAPAATNKEATDNPADSAH